MGKHPLSFDTFLLTETLEMKIPLPPVKKMYLTEMSVVSYDRAAKKETSATLAESATPSVVSAVRKHFSLGEGMVSPAWAAERSLLPSISTDSRRLRKRFSIQLIRLGIRLALRAPRHKREHLSHPHYGYKVMTSVLGSKTVREREWPRSGCGVGGWKKSVSGAETPPTVEPSQAKRQEINHGLFPDSVPQSLLLGYEPSLYFGSLAALAVFDQGSRLSAALRDEDLGSRESSWVARLRSTSIRKEHQASIFSLVKAVKFLG